MELMAVVHSPVFSSRKEIKWQHMGQTITKQTERDFLSCRKLRSQANLLWSSLHYLDHLLENIPNNLVSFVCIEYLSIAQKFPQPLNKNCRLRRCPAHRFGCRRVSEFPSSSALMVLNFTASGTQGSWKGWCCSAGTYTGHQCKQPNHGTGLQHLL